MGHEAKNDVIYQMQDRLEKLEHDYENLVEQVRLADQQRFGRHTEKLDEIAGQISLFNEAEACFDEQVQEPSIDDVVDNALKPARRPKKKGQREEDLKDFPQEEIPHDVPLKKLYALFGEGNYKSMPDEICWQLVLNPPDGLQKSTSSKYMWGPMARIRMNSCVATTRIPCTAAA